MTKRKLISLYRILHKILFNYIDNCTMCYIISNTEVGYDL